MTDPGHSTVTGALRLVAYLVVGLRAGTLVQMLPSAVAAVDGSPRPWLTVLSWILAVTMLGTIGLLALIRRRPPSAGWAIADVAVVVVLALLSLPTVPLHERTGGWVGFLVPYAIAVACSLVGVGNRNLWVALAAVLLLAEAVYLVPTVREPADLPAMLGNLLTLVVLAPLAWFGARAILQIAREADEARAFAAAMARDDEERRARLAMHNGAALMRMMVDRGPDGDESLRAQLVVEINRMRAYLTGSAAPDGISGDLAEVVESVADEFAHLPIAVVADLARGVELGSELVEDLGAALRSLMINVGEHADASKVVVHAAEDEAGAGWAVTVHDDGVGFDTTAAYGVGLGGLVIDDLARHGISTVVHSLPGSGTTVVLAFNGDPEPALPVGGAGIR